MKKFVSAVAALGVALLMVGCTEEPPAGPPPTTPQVGPPAGCYDSAVDTADFTYSGTPNVIGNMTLHSSGDGSCTGIHIDPHVLTLVYSTNGSADASTFCTANGLEYPQPLDARTPQYDFRLNGVTIGPDAYLCVQPL